MYSNHLARGPQYGEEGAPLVEKRKRRENLRLFAPGWSYLFPISLGRYTIGVEIMNEGVIRSTCMNIKCTARRR